MFELKPDGLLYIGPFLAVTTGIVVLFIGKGLNERVGLLREYSIPEPVTGGLLFSLAAWVLYLVSGFQIEFELTARDILLVYFFTTIGINAHMADLRQGGRPLLLLLAATVAFMVVQNLIAVVIAPLLGYPAVAGLLAGSVSLLGGHGTAIAWAPVFSEQFGLTRAMEAGVLAATAGLILAGLAGGPLAHYLIRRHALGGTSRDAPDIGVTYGGERPTIEYFSFLQAILAIHLSGVVGILLNRGLASVGISLPLFVTCLLAGILLTNVLPVIAPRARWPTRSTALALIAEVSLGVFLAMSLMSLQLWSLADLAGPVMIVLAVQLVAALAYGAFVVFPLLGRGYDAAVISAGFIGFGLGATPTAMANMTAITQRHGASHLAFLVVPIVGAFFIDLANAGVVRAFIALLQ